MSLGVMSQSAPNWRVIKQVFLQGSKPPSPPEPTGDGLGEGGRAYAQLLMLEMENLCRYNLSKLEEKMQQAFQSFGRRIAALEEEITFLKKQKIAMNKRAPIHNQDEYNGIIGREGEEGKPTSFIHIEQDDEESLLEPETTQKQPIILNSEMPTARRPLGRSTTNMRRLFEDGSMERMKHPSSQAMRPLSTKQSAYFERDGREEMEALRGFIEQAHGITLQSYPFLPEVAVTVKDIEVEPSNNGLVHLQNENNELRSRMLRLEVQLQRGKDELERVRQMLLRGVEEQDFGPYASVL